MVLGGAIFETCWKCFMKVNGQPEEGDEPTVSSLLSSSNSTSHHSNSTNRRITLMDFFDVRKFQSSHRDFVVNDGRLHVVSDYSLIALLPVILVGLLITTIFCVYRFRRWKHNKKQLAELNAFYEIVESSPCLASGKPYLIQHCKDVEKSECDRITRAVCVPTQSSIFFQPIPPKAKSVRCNSDVLKAVNASEVLFHFAQLPTIEKINNNNNKKSLHFIHRV